jgi:hypothetical protein
MKNSSRQVLRSNAEYPPRYPSLQFCLPVKALLPGVFEQPSIRTVWSFPLIYLADCHRRAILDILKDH